MQGTALAAQSIAVAVGEIATRAAVYPSSLRCRDAESLFFRDLTRDSLLVRRPDGTISLVDRASFLNAMMGPLGYGHPLNAERLVEATVDSSGTFVVPAHYP